MWGKGFALFIYHADTSILSGHSAYACDIGSMLPLGVYILCIYWYGIREGVCNKIINWLTFLWGGWSGYNIQYEFVVSEWILLSVFEVALGLSISIMMRCIELCVVLWSSSASMILSTEQTCNSVWNFDGNSKGNGQRIVRNFHIDI